MREGIWSKIFGGSSEKSDKLNFPAGFNPDQETSDADVANHQKLTPEQWEAQNNQTKEK